MKRKTAKEILSESLRELAEEKSIDKITIRDITDNCGYSSATFYRQFKDKYDLIAWDYARSIDSIIENVGKDGHTWAEAIEEVVLHFQKERDYLVNLLTHTGGHDSFTSYMTEIHFRKMSQHIEFLNENKLDKQTEMNIRLYCLGAICLSCEWIVGAIKATPEELMATIVKALPEPLR